MPWKNVKVRADLHEMVARRAKQETRSVAQMTDRLLMRALEQETENLSVDGEAHRGAAPLVPAPSPARAPVAQRIEGQTTVDEMLASCPNCAGELHRVDVAKGGLVVTEGAQGCLDCGYVREGT